MATDKQSLTEFMYEFDVPTKDFLSTEPKALKIKIEFVNKTSQQYMRGSVVDTYRFENCYFILNIPKYIVDYIKNKMRIYSKDGIDEQGTFDNGKPYYRENYDFKQFIKREKLTDLIKDFQQIINDALYIKKLEDLQNFNKVIFIKSSFGKKEMVDRYNNGRTGNKLDLSFQFFVAYKVIKKKNMDKYYWQVETDKNDEVIEYYATSQKPTFTNSTKELPVLTGYEVKSFREIPWTEERERFFKDVEMKIQKVSELISNFVDDVNEDNIDIKIAENKFIMLEDKSE